MKIDVFLLFLVQNQKGIQGEETRERKRERVRRERAREEPGVRSPRASYPQSQDRERFSAAAAGSELLRVSNPGRLSDITPFLVG